MSSTKLENENIPPRQRNRASAACTACRASRTKCFIDKGQSQCDQCRRNNTECIIRDDDGRKRPGAKNAYTSMLLQRIEALEGMLVEKRCGSAQPNKESISPSLGCESHSNYDPEYITRASHNDAGSSVMDPLMQLATSAGTLYESSIANSQPETAFKTSETVLKLIAPGNHLRTEAGTGRVYHVGRTANMHVLAQDSLFKHSQVSSDSHWRIEMLLPELSSETLEYLVGLYWTYHNSTIHLVHLNKFNDDKTIGKSQFYSTFLHFCMLSVGYRYSDKSRLDIQKIALPGYESTLHQKALKMVEYELKKPGGIPSVQALFLLGDLECACGRDDTGWMFGGMSFRLALDIGLHLGGDPKAGLIDLDVQIRYMVMWACIINDKNWSLYLGRPTNVKSDFLLTGIPKRFDDMIRCNPNPKAHKTLETVVYEHLLVLMDISGTITDILNAEDVSLGNDSYFKMAALDKQLKAWYSKLPPALKWTTRNVTVCPYSYFLLHQQYHTSFILLHRPFVDYRSPASLPASDSDEDLLHYTNTTSIFSREVCLHHANRVATIFRSSRRRFDSRRTFVTGIQHAGTAAMALLAEVATAASSSDRNMHLKNLKCLSDVLAEMSETYLPAKSMSTLLSQCIRELGLDLNVANRDEHTPTTESTSKKRDYETMENQTNAISELPSKSSSRQPGIYSPIQQPKDMLYNGQDMFSSDLQDAFWTDVSLYQNYCSDEQGLLSLLDAGDQTVTDPAFLVDA